MGKGTNAGGRTKEANETSIVYIHQHGGKDVTCKPPVDFINIFCPHEKWPGASVIKIKLQS